MKIAFITGIKFTEFNENYYSTTFSSQLIYDRYLSVFDEFYVFASVFPGNQHTPNSMMLSSGNGVNFIFQQSAKRPIDFFLKTAALKRELSNFISCMDGVIIRLPSTLGLIAHNVCRKQGKPYLVEAVGCPWDSLWNHSFLGKLLAPSTFFRTRICIRNAPYVVYTSERFLPKRYPTNGKSTHASNVVLPKFNDLAIERRLNKISLAKESLTIGSCGQIDLPFKGHKIVVEAISILNRQGFDFRYELLGAGDPEYILNIAHSLNVEDKIKIIGRKQQKAVFEWLDTIDIYAQPSLTEGMPRALLEAMSRGVPCLGSDAGAIPEILPPHYLFKNKNIKSLIKTLKCVLSHPLQAAAEVYARAKDYDSNIINARRKSIFKDFKDYIIQTSTGTPLI